MLANGYQNHHLAFFILKKISLMMISIGIVSCLVSSGVLKIISFFDISKKIKQAAHENDEELIRAIEFMFEEK